jgi:hypothetical protein
VTWNSVAMPAGSATLDVLSCSSSTCEAAGSSYNGAPAPILTSANGGGTWTSLPSVASSVSAVSGVTCNSGTNCVFVGRSGKTPVAVTNTGGVVSGGTPVAAMVRTQKVVSR